MSSETVLAELRLTTRAEHDRIDSLLRLNEPMTLQRYGAIMCGFDAFLRAWEPRIHAALPERLQGWFRLRRRGGFASADVEWLRAVACVEPVPAAAHMAATLPLRDLADVMGSLYVIEGSALGGRVIAPQLRKSLGLDQGRGASYFHGFGGETGVMWANFRVLAALEVGESSRHVVRACNSARRTFAAMIELFEPLVGASASRVEPAAAPAPAQVAPALLRAFAEDDPESTLPMPLDVAQLDLDAAAVAPPERPADASSDAPDRALDPRG